MSLFADALRGLLDEAKLFTRSEWAEILNVKEETIEDWLGDRKLPRPEDLRSIDDTIKEDLRTPGKLLARFETMAVGRAWDVSPFGKEIGPTVSHYMTRPLREAFMRWLDCLPQKEQEELLYRAVDMCRDRTKQIEAGQQLCESGILGKESPTGDKGTVKNVWTIPGCIVCDLCEDIVPEVFQMMPTTVRIRTEDQGMWGLWSDKIIESAVGCPVNVIKYELVAKN